MGNFVRSALSVKASANLDVAEDLKTEDPGQEKTIAILKGDDDEDSSRNRQDRKDKDN